MNNLFIMTKDKCTADTLAKLGFRKICSDQCGIFYFQNQAHFNFNAYDIDKNKIAFTNVMHI